MDKTIKCLALLVVALFAFSWAGAQVRPDSRPLAVYHNRCADTASAASVSLPDCETVLFTGVIDVATITPCDNDTSDDDTTAGRELTIICDAEATVIKDEDNNGGVGNIQLRDDVDFTCAPDQVLKLMCEGTGASTGKWREVGRTGDLAALSTANTWAEVQTFESGNNFQAGLSITGGVITLVAGCNGLDNDGALTANAFGQVLCSDDDMLDVTQPYTWSGAQTFSSTHTLSALNCTSNANGGALTTDGSGIVSCSDDNATERTLCSAHVVAGANEVITRDDCDTLYLSGAGSILTLNTCDTVTDREMLIICEVNPGDTIELKNTGNIRTGSWLSAGSSWGCTEKDTYATILLGCHSDDKLWYEIARNNARDYFAKQVEFVEPPKFSALNCTGNANGGALTTDGDGVVSCSDDDYTDTSTNHSWSGRQTFTNSLTIFDDSQLLIGHVPGTPAITNDTNSDVAFHFQSDTDDGYLGQNQYGFEFDHVGTASKGLVQFSDAGVIETTIGTDGVVYKGEPSDGNPFTTREDAHTWSATQTYSVPIEVDVGIDGTATGSGTSITLDAAGGGHTGDLLDVDDGGSTKFTINSAGNVQLFNGGRLFIANGSDEGSFAEKFGNAVIYDTTTGTPSESTYRAMYLRKELKPSATGSNSTSYGLYTESFYQPSAASLSWGAVVGGNFDAQVYGQTYGGLTIGTVEGGRFIVTLNSGTTATATITSMAGGRFQVYPSAQNKTVTNMYGVWVDDPGAPGSGTTVTNAYGLFVEDQKARGANNAAVFVEAQDTSTGATQGNIVMQGGDWDDGHIQLENGHMWYEPANDVFRVSKDDDGSAPTAADDGFPLPLSHGELYGDDNVTATTVSATSTWYQITTFDNDGQEFLENANHFNDDITILDDGIYMVMVTLAFSNSGVNVTYEFEIQTNNGATSYPNIHTERKIGTGGDIGSASMSGLASFSAGDTVELWVQQVGGSATDITVRDVNLSVVRIK